MSDLNINNITDRLGESGPVIAGVSTVSSGQFVVPVGPTEYRGGRGRGVFYCGGPAPYNVMDYITIASTGNATDFGDAINTRYMNGHGGCASSTRGVFGGGSPQNSEYNYSSSDYRVYYYFNNRRFI